MIPDALSLSTYRLTLVARDRLELPPYKGSTLRGGFGINFKRMVCFQPKGQPCQACLLRHNCPYPYLFESFPPPGAEVLSKNQYIARPFVIEPPLDDRTEYLPGESFSFRLTLVGRAQQLLAYLVVAFQELGRITGLGRGRGKYRLGRVEVLHPLSGETALVYQENRPETILMPQLPVTAGQIDAQAATLSPHRIRLRFLTPTRLVHRGSMVADPPFHVLLRRLLDRVSSLSYFHCGQRWEIDFKGWIKRAKEIRLADCHTDWMNVERYSGRQDARLSLGGFVGDVVYEGELAPFLPLLVLGSLVHVGKATVFGNGRYQIEP